MLIKLDKVYLDIFWLKDTILSKIQPISQSPNGIAADVVEYPEAALEQFREIAPDLREGHMHYKET